jgi:hypothetical protein
LHIQKATGSVTQRDWSSRWIAVGMYSVNQLGYILEQIKAYCQRKLREGRLIKFSKAVGLKRPYVVDDPLPDFDHCGYEVTINTVLYSWQPGAHSNKYTHFDTVRKLHTTFSNHCQSTAPVNQSSWAIGDTRGKYQQLGMDPCSWFWFYRFMEGMKRHMGQDWRPNKAISRTLMVFLKS